MTFDSVVDAVHPELIALEREVALTAPANKLLALQDGILRRIHPLLGTEIATPDAVDFAMSVATANGLCETAYQRQTAEHVLRESMAGRSAGIGYGSRPAEDTPPPRAQFHPLNICEFLKLELPPRRNILAPWLPEKGLVQIYSLRGVGKTFLGLSTSYAVASAGKLLGWKVLEPRRVLYVDAEMPATTMQERLATIVAGFGNEPPSPEFFRMLSADLSENGLPDLATRDGQRVLDDCVGDAELIIADNISTLCRSGKENEAESWAIVQEWALAHRRAGRSLIFMHHAGKGGAQRGTSKREDVLDTVIALRRPQDYRSDQGARFEVHFEKARGFHGADAESFEAKFEIRDGAAIWTRTAITDAELKRVADAIRDGMSIREAAKELGLNKSKVERLKDKAKQQGLLDD